MTIVHVRFVHDATLAVPLKYQRS